MLNLLDIIIVFAYLFIILIIGFSVGRKETLDDFFVNSRKTKLWLLVFSIISTNFGAATYIGITSAAYDTGISYGLSVMFIVVAGFFLTAIFAPYIKNFSDKHQLYTLPDFFEKRYSQRNKILTSGIILFAYFFFMAAQFRGGALLLNLWTGVDINIAIWTATFTMILYTAFAGIKSDFYTDRYHFFIMTGVLFILLVKIFPLVNGSNGITNLDESYFSPVSFGGELFFYGSLILGIPLMLVSMEIWQRIYAATDEKTAKKAFIWSAILSLPYIIGFIFLGLSTKILYPHLSNKDLALFYLINNHLTLGIKGLAIAGFLAAILSTANSMIMVNSVVIVKNWYLRNKNQQDLKNDKRILWKVRGLTCGVGLTGLLFATVFPDIVQLTINGFQIIAVLAPAIIGGFLLSKPSEQASFWSILVGIVVSLFIYPLLEKKVFIISLFMSIVVFIYLQKKESGG